MSKAVRITGIIWIILCAILTIVFGIISIVGYGAVDQAAQEIAKADSSINLEQAKAAALLAVIYLDIVAGYFFLGLVFSIIFVALARKEIRKGAGIALGIIGFIFGAELPGIFFIVHSAKDLK